MDRTSGQLLENQQQFLRRDPSEAGKAPRHCSNLSRVWVQKYEAGETIQSRVLNDNDASNLPISASAFRRSSEKRPAAQRRTRPARRVSTFSRQPGESDAAVSRVGDCKLTLLGNSRG
jgi:hypothetical protein